MADKGVVIVAAVVAAALIGIALLNFSGGSHLISPTGATEVPAITPAISSKDTGVVQSFSGPAGRYVYMVTIIAPEGGHVITAEYLLNNLGGMKEWRFSQYENTDITPGGWQMPYGNASQKTVVEIHKVTNLTVVGDSDLVVDGEVFPTEFFIDPMGNVTSNGQIAPMDCYTGIPAELAARLAMLKAYGQFGISNCSTDPVQKVFTLSIFNNHDPVAVAQFQSLNNGGWRVRIIEDTDLEQSQQRAHEQLHTLKTGHPELRIAAYDLIMDSRTRPVQKIAEVFVTANTLENRELNGTEIDSWKVRVLELYELKRGNGGK